MEIFGSIQNLKGIYISPGYVPVVFKQLLLAVSKTFCCVSTYFIMADKISRGFKIFRELYYVGWFILATNGPLARYVKLRVRMRREFRERFPRHRR